MKQRQRGRSFHWVSDESAFDQVAGVLESGTGGGEARERDKGGPEEDTGSGSAFEASGCRADCEETYENFTSLRFTYTWKEIQARNGYILHGLHNDDIPVELVTTTSSQNGAVCTRAEGDSGDITENIWYTGSRGSGEIQAETAGREVQTLKAPGSPSSLIQRGSLRLPTQDGSLLPPMPGSCFPCCGRRRGAGG